MANVYVAQWNRGAKNATLPHTTDHKDVWYAILDGSGGIGGANVPNLDWMVTAPIPQDISSDFIISAYRVLGSNDLNLDVEGSIHGGGDKNDSSSWDSITGGAFTWAGSGSTSATTAGDHFRYDIGENGVMPRMRLGYRNSSGSTFSSVWRVYISFERGM